MDVTENLPTKDSPESDEDARQRHQFLLSIKLAKDGKSLHKVRKPSRFPKDGMDEAYRQREQELMNEKIGELLAFGPPHPKTIVKLFEYFHKQGLWSAETQDRLGDLFKAWRPPRGNHIWDVKSKEKG